MTPVGTERNIVCVICHNCNTVVGTLDYISVTEEHDKLQNQLGIINKKLETVNNNIGQLMNGLKLVYGKIENKNVKNNE